ncbi:hypothetical protein Tco_0522927 [Tanacetum coccineum]
MIVGVSRDLRGDSWGCVPLYLFWRENLNRDGECGFDYLTFALVSSKAHREGVGLRVADSHTGNHPEGGFTPLKTIRRLLVVIGRRSYSGFKGEAFKPGHEEMDFRIIIYTENDYDFAFLPKEPSLGFGIGSPPASVNIKPPKDVKEPEVQPAEVTADSGESPKAGMFVVHPRSVAVRIKERKCKTWGGSSRPHVKRKLASGSLSSRVVHAKTSTSKDDAPFLSISDDDEG